MAPTTHMPFELIGVHLKSGVLRDEDVARRGEEVKLLAEWVHRNRQGDPAYLERFLLEVGRRPIKAVTLNRYLSLTSTIFKAAVHLGFARDNPCSFSAASAWLGSAMSSPDRTSAR